MRKPTSAVLATAILVALLASAPLRPAQAQQGAALSDLLIAIRSHFPYVPSMSAISEATPLVASSGDVAAATATATLTGVAGKTTYLHGFDITGTGATAGVGVACTVTGILGGTITFDFAVIAGVTLNNAASFRFPFHLPSSAVNTNLVVSCPSFGAGNLHAAVTAYGALASN